MGPLKLIWYSLYQFYILLFTVSGNYNAKNKATMEKGIIAVIGCKSYFFVISKNMSLIPSPIFPNEQTKHNPKLLILVETNSEE